jgi:antitoxin component YwqK of YwqJK toxin-antitoxin module
MTEQEKVISENDLEQDGEIILFEGEPFTGIGVDHHKNGQKKTERNYKDGKENGVSAGWYENGKKSHEFYFKDGKE